MSGSGKFEKNVNKFNACGRLAAAVFFVGNDKNHHEGGGNMKSGQHFYKKYHSKSHLTGVSILVQ